MPLPIQKFREAVFQILFTSDFAPVSEDTIYFMMAELKTTRREIQGAIQRVEQILDKQLDLDEAISTQSTEYSLERISKVERSILRLGLYEILYDPTIPPKVAISEGIRLARKFGTNESAQFINAILDGVYKQRVIPEEPVPV